MCVCVSVCSGWFCGGRCEGTLGRNTGWRTQIGPVPVHHVLHAMRTDRVMERLDTVDMLATFGWFCSQM